MNTKERKEQLQGRFALAGLICLCVFSWVFPWFMDTHFPVKGAEREDSSCYIICDVDRVDDAVHVVMTDGSIREFDIPDDAPTAFDEVCFYAEDIDDYATYEIVALR